MITAPFCLSELPSLLQLWNQSSPYDQLSEGVFHEKIWGDPDYHDDLSLVVHQDGQPIAMALGVARKMVIEHRGYIKLLAVAPDARRNGIACRLVKELEDKLTHLNVAAIRVGESAPNYLFPGVDVRYANATQLFESFGYEQVGQAKNLIANLQGKDFSTEFFENGLNQKGIQVRRASADDAESMDQLIAQYWPAWRAEIATGLQNDPISIHLAIRDEQVIGFSVYDSNNLGTGWFGPMGTHSDFQGLGIGKILMLRCLHDIQTQGHRQAIIAWVSPTRLYAKHADAEPGRTFNRYEKRLISLPSE